MKKRILIKGRLKTGLSLFTFGRAKNLAFAAACLILFPVLSSGAHGMLYPGDIVINVGHENEDRAIYDGYGLMFRIVDAGLPVTWIIKKDKIYGGPDLQGIYVDSRPDRDEDFTDGMETMRDFSGGPFVIGDPDPDTAYNEAWDVIASIQEDAGFSHADLYELRSTVELGQEEAHTIAYLPRIAVADNKFAVEELEAVNYPDYTLVPAPGRFDDPSTVAGGALFFGAPCENNNGFDMFFQGHYKWGRWDSGDDHNDHQPGDDENGADLKDHNEKLAQQEIDRFISAGGLGLFECLSATIENDVHWVTQPGTTIVKGHPQSRYFEFDESLATHPFLQTMGNIQFEGGAFAAWDMDENAFLSNVQSILYDPDRQVIGNLFATHGAGKVVFMGGHKRRRLAGKRLVFNAILFHAMTPCQKTAKGARATELTPDRLAAGIENSVTVNKRILGSVFSQNIEMADVLAPGVELDMESIEFMAPGGSYSWNADARSLTIRFNEIHPHETDHGLIASYRVLVVPPGEGTIQILTSAGLSVDYWHSNYTAQTSNCLNVEVGSRPDLVFDLYPDAVDQDIAGTVREAFDYCVSNRGNTSVFRDSDSIRLHIPNGFGTPSNIVTPDLPTDEWASSWDPDGRMMTFSYLGGDFDWMPEMDSCFRMDLAVPPWTGIERFPETASLQYRSLNFGDTDHVLVRGVAVIGLLRNDEISTLSVVPNKAGIFTGSGTNSLDRDGPNGYPEIGEGSLRDLPGSGDDDDFYILDFESGSPDPDPGCVVSDTSRPLIFYQVTVEGNTLRMHKEFFHTESNQNPCVLIVHYE
ncbi:hypothetical protein ACFLU6_03555 [Acidobacteriota bacterium]